MARYIDADALMQDVKRNSSHGLSEWSTIGVMCLIERQPTVDVVSRIARELHDKIAMEICSKIGREINDALQSNYKVLPQIEQSEALWNRVSGKIDALRGIDDFIADLLEEYMIREISNEEKCLVCGDVIPEGRQVCPNCEEGGDN